MAETVADFLRGDETIQKVILACFGAEILAAYQAALRDV